MSNIVQFDDSQLTRNRGIRLGTFLGTPVVLSALSGLLVGYLASTFLNVENGPTFGTIGFVIGSAMGFIGFLAIKPYFLVQNDTTGMLVTINQLQTLFQGDEKKPAFVFYGPGTHFSLPWEVRYAKNNIPVVETSEEFTFTAICTDGTLTGKGSFRLRPDFENPIAYLSGVGAVAGDLKDLIIAFINSWLAKKSMQQALDEQGDLKRDLHEEFVKDGKKTGFEERFGVRLGDATVSELLMSGEAQRTRSALNEASVISQGTAILLGFKSVDEMQAALSAKRINQDDVDRARRDFRIISGNMDGATVNRFEVDIKGLTPEVAGALATLFSNPEARAIAKNIGKGTNQPPKGKRK